MLAIFALLLAASKYGVNFVKITFKLSRLCILCLLCNLQLLVELLFLLCQELNIAVGLLLLVLKFCAVNLSLEHLGFKIEVDFTCLDCLLLNLDSRLLVDFPLFVFNLKFAPQIINL